MRSRVLTSEIRGEGNCGGDGSDRDITGEKIKRLVMMASSWERCK